jgi:hypothetical protein
MEIAKKFRGFLYSLLKQSYFNFMVFYFSNSPLGIELPSGRVFVFGNWNMFFQLVICLKGKDDFLNFHVLTSLLESKPRLVE